MPKVCLKKYLTICLEPPQSTAFLLVLILEATLPCAFYM